MDNESAVIAAICFLIGMFFGAVALAVVVRVTRRMIDEPVGSTKEESQSEVDFEMDVDVARNRREILKQELIDSLKENGFEYAGPDRYVKRVVSEDRSCGKTGETDKQ